MSIFKKIAGLFSSQPTTSAVTVVSTQETEVLSELEAGKAELAELQAKAKKAQKELKAKTERAIKMRQAEQALASTYRSLEQTEDLLEVLTDSIKQAEEDIDSSALSALDMARRLKQERMDKKMAKLGSAPVPRYISPTPTNAPAPTSVPPVVTGTLPSSFNVSKNQPEQITNFPTHYEWGFF